MQVALIGSVHHARNPLFFCKIQKCREQVVFADITAVDRICPDGFQLHLIDLDNFMDRAQLLCHPLRDLQITGWVQHGVKCHGINRHSRLLRRITRQLENQAAVHTAGKSHAKVFAASCVLSHQCF